MARQVLVALLSVAMACTRERETVAGPVADLLRQRLRDAETSTQYSYLYQGQSIPLEVDSSYLVVASSGGVSEAAIRSALLPMSAGAVKSLPQVANHWIVQLPPSTADAFAGAISRLAAGQFDFVSPGFRTVQGGRTLTLVDRLMVQFRAGVPRESIDSMLGTLGARVLRSPGLDPEFQWYLVS